jgi:hypothetical protein
MSNQDIKNMEISREGFEAFIKSQNPDKEVIHGQGWSTCAVGEYAEMLQERASYVAEVLAEQYGVDYYGTTPREPSLHDVLNYSGFVPEIMFNIGEEMRIYPCKTYGQIAELIDNINNYTIARQ